MIAFLRRSWIFVLVLGLAALGLTACMSVSPAVRSPGEIAGVASAANMGEIEQGMIARQKAQAPVVREYAERMILEHTRAEERQRALFRRQGIAPEESPLSQELTAMARTVAAALRSAEADEFDMLYMDSQIMMHQRTLVVLDTELIPAARIQPVRAELVRMRTIVQDHLNRAREIRGMLEGRTAY